MAYYPAADTQRDAVTIGVADYQLNAGIYRAVCHDRWWPGSCDDNSAAAHLSVRIPGWEFWQGQRSGSVTFSCSGDLFVALLLDHTPCKQRSKMTMNIMVRTEKRWERRRRERDEGNERTLFSAAARRQPLVRLVLVLMFCVLLLLSL